MPIKFTREALDAELRAIRRQLMDAESANDYIGVKQFQYKLEQVQDELGQLDLPDQVDEPASVALLFGGGPVFGSRGIAADFSGAALDRFQDLVSKVFASSDQEPLGKRGTIPGKSQSTFMISELARGSFGFVLEESGVNAESSDHEKLGDSLDTTLKILEETGSQNEPDFQELLDSLDPRILQGLREFFKTLDSADATLRAVDDLREVNLDRLAIDRGRQRTEATDISESPRALNGKLIGFLPEHKKFEAMTTDQRSIYGTVSSKAVDAFQSLSADGQQVIGSKFSLNVIERRITRLGSVEKTAYHLTDIVDSKADSVG